MRYSKVLVFIAGTALAIVSTSSPEAARAAGGQVTDAEGLSAESLAAKLGGPGVEVLGATMSGDPRSLGVFSGMSDMGIDSGVALSTGKVVDLPGVSGQSASSTMNTSGADDLETEITHRPTFDAAVLEFDFRPRANQVSFHYVFASEEYMEWVGEYNDAFAFFINGVNCAVVDGDPVSVNTINAVTRHELYVDNQSAPSVGTKFNGFTRPLTCQAAVTKGGVNHARLVVADGRDPILDAIVLISSDGISSNTPPVAADLEETLAPEASVELVYPGHDDDGDALTYQVVSSPAHGTVIPGPAGAVYTAAGDYTGVDSFTYTVSDGLDVSPPYTVTLTIAAGHPAEPALSVPDAEYSIDQGDALSIPLAAAPDAPGVATDFEVVEPPATGTLSGSGNSRTYQSTEDFAGTTSFRYVAHRGAVTSTSGTVTIVVRARATGGTVPPDQPRRLAAEPAVTPASTLASTGADVPIWASGAAALLLVVAGAALSRATVRRRARPNRGGALSRDAT